MVQLIFLPGASGSTEFWHPLIQSLPQHDLSKIIAYPAFACEPENPAINNFEQLQDYVLQKIDHPCILIAQSMGGIFAVAAALQKSDLVKGLVLIATSGGIDLSRFDVVDWRDNYKKEFLNYPDWFMTTKVNYESKLTQIFQKTLLIWGDQDSISPISVGKYLQCLLQDAQLKIIKGGAHDLANHYAEQVAIEIALYLDQVDINTLKSDKE